MGTICEARGSLPGIENSGAYENHGGLCVPFFEVSVFLWGIFETPGGRLVCSRQVVMGSGQLERLGKQRLLCGVGFESSYLGKSSSN